jgi:hypothetical protein
MTWSFDAYPGGRSQANTMGQNTCQNQNKFPNLGMAKNKVKKSGMFLATTQRQFSHHVSPRIPPRSNHQKPCSNTLFFPNPPQKHQQKRKDPTPLPAQDFF